jgi:hypothetical protein
MSMATFEKQNKATFIFKNGEQNRLQIADPCLMNT